MALQEMSGITDRPSIQCAAGQLGPQGMKTPTVGALLLHAYCVA